LLPPRAGEAGTIITERKAALGIQVQCPEDISSLGGKIGGEDQTASVPPEDRASLREFILPRAWTMRVPFWRRVPENETWVP